MRGKFDTRERFARSLAWDRPTIEPVAGLADRLDQIETHDGPVSRAELREEELRRDDETDDPRVGRATRRRGVDVAGEDVEVDLVPDRHAKRFRGPRAERYLRGTDGQVPADEGGPERPAIDREC